MLKLNDSAFDVTAPVHAIDDLPQDCLHDELARRRVYLHPIRWTSLGLSLLEAMHLAMPVVALATTEVAEAVPPEAGVVSTDVDVLATESVPQGPWRYRTSRSHRADRPCAR